LLAHLLRLGEIVEVNVPRVEQEAARDLVRAREDARADLMRARHRVSKMLLRQGIVYSAGDGWTKVHDSWLRGQRFDQKSRERGYDSGYEGSVCAGGRWGGRARVSRACSLGVTDAVACKQQLHPGGAPARLPARHLHTDRFRAGG